MSFRPLDVLRFAAVLASLSVLSVSANAYSARVQSACRGDYFAHCSQFSVGTPEVAQCMRKVGEGLSLPCLAALADDGQISKAEIDAYYARQQAKAGGKTGASVPKSVAAAKANPGSKAASLTKQPGKTAKAANSLAAGKYQKPAGPAVASAKNYESYESPASSDVPAKKIYGKKYSSEPNYYSDSDDQPRTARAPAKSIRSDDTIVAKNTKRRSRDDDDDGWYDDNYFGGRGGYSRYATEYAPRGAYYGPPDPYQNPRDRDEYRW